MNSYFASNEKTYSFNALYELLHYSLMDLTDH